MQDKKIVVILEYWGKNDGGLPEHQPKLVKEMSLSEAIKLYPDNKYYTFDGYKKIIEPFNKLQIAKHKRLKTPVDVKDIAKIQANKLLKSIPAERGDGGNLVNRFKWWWYERRLKKISEGKVNVEKLNWPMSPKKKKA